MAFPPSPTPQLVRQLAEQEAGLAGQTLVGPEHLLIALASPDITSGPNALGTFRLSSDQLRIAVHELADRAMARPIGRLGFSVLAERSLYNADVYASRDQSPTNHHHLLAGVLSVNSPNVARVLAKLGASVVELQRVVGLGPLPVRPSPNGTASNTASSTAASSRAVSSRAVSTDQIGVRVDELVARVDQLSTMVEHLLLTRQPPR